MPFKSGLRPFNRPMLETFSREVSGVWGVFDGPQAVYVEASARVHQRLVEALNGDLSACVSRHRLRYFGYEEAAGEQDSQARAAALIAEYAPLCGG